MSSVDDIKARLDVVSIVSEYVSLQKAGRNFKAPCPFHNERTPSFIVNPERQSWRCFGACATGGDIFTFVMRKEGVEFGDALRLLAQKAGVELTQRSQEERDHNDTLYSINKEAAQFYQKALESSKGEIARKYLDERGVNDESRARFELGYSPDSWDALKNHLTRLGFSEADAIASGLVHQNDNGRSWDFFRGRLMFPIHDRQGRVAGFGARALDDSTPKYINTSQTIIFNKRDTLYGLHIAAGPIRTQNTAVVVEGYMDVIAAHEHGYNNVVASMGTALTENQVAQLKSMVTNFVLALDPDVAGQEATLRSLEASWRVIGHQTAAIRNRSVGVLYQREQANLKIAALPTGKDPDKLIRESPEEWERLTKGAKPLIDFLIPTLTSRFDVSTGQGISQVVEIIKPIIQSAEFFEQEGYIIKLAEALHVRVDSIKASIGGTRSRNNRRDSRRQGFDEQSAPSKPEITVSPLTSRPEDSLENYTLALLLNRPELIELVSDLHADHFHNVENREVFTALLNCKTIDHLKESLDESLYEHLARLTQKEMAPADRVESEKALQQCRHRLERRHLLELQESLLTSDDASVMGGPPPREMEADITAVNEKIKQLSSHRI